MAKIKALDLPGLKSRTLSTLFDPSGDGAALEKAMTALCEAASAAVAEGCSIIVLSDRGVNEKMARSRAAGSRGVHHHLVDEGTRTRASLVLESGEPREVHHFALLIGLRRGRHQPVPGLRDRGGSVCQGLLKSRTRRSGAGLHQVHRQGRREDDVQDGHLHGAELPWGADLRGRWASRRRSLTGTFAGTPSGSRAWGSRKCRWRRRHDTGGPSRRPGSWPGYWTADAVPLAADGEEHLYAPETIHLLQLATRSGDYETYKRYAERLAGEDRALRNLRAHC